MNSRPYLALLDRLTKVFHSSLDPKVVLKLALIDIVKLLRATSGSVMLINPESRRLEIEAAVGLSHKGKHLRLHTGEGVTGWVALHGKPLRIPDVRADPRYIPARHHIRSELAVPLGRNGSSKTNEGGEILGVLNVDSTRLSAFTMEDEELLMTLAGQVSSLIENAWLYEQTRRKANQLDSLLKLSESIMAIETFPEILQEVASGACTLLNSKFSAVLLLDQTGDKLDWNRTSEETHLQIPKHSLSVDDSQLGVVVRRKKPVNIYDIQKSDPLLYALLEPHRKLSSLLGMPLITGDRILGVLCVFTQRPHRFSNDELQLLNALSNQAAVAIQRCQLSERFALTEEDLRQNERLSAIGLLAAEVAHEIRNPLTVIKMLTHSLEKEVPKKDPRRKDFEVLSRKMEQMNRTVEQVLGLARNNEPVFESLPINPIVEELVLLLRHKLAHQNVNLRLTLAPDLPPVSMDRTQIEQALLNIALNALHAMPKGGDLDLMTGMTEDKKNPSKKVWIEIRDSGMGMTDKQKENLFQPFLTSKTKGTGLGMAIVHKTIKAHQGEWKIRSRVNRGTSIRILFPISTPISKINLPNPSLAGGENFLPLQRGS